MKEILKKKLVIWIIFTINLLFAFSIGLTIPLLKTKYSYNLGLIMIPLLIIFNYILVDRFYYYLKHSNERKENFDENA
jgi:hypothetical protein